MTVRNTRSLHRVAGESGRNTALEFRRMRAQINATRGGPSTGGGGTDVTITVPAFKYLVSVRNGNGILTSGRSLTVTVHQHSGSSLTVAAVPADRSAVVVTDLGAGFYLVVYTPTHKGYLYRTTIVSDVDDDVFSPTSEFQDLCCVVVTTP